MNFQHANLSRVCILAASLSIPASALAQAALEEIVVTAQKREQSLTDVPVSVQVLSGEDFIEQGLNTLEDAANFIPGLQVEQTEGGATVRIRGISNEGFNVGFEQATAVFNDGVYYGRQLQALAGVYDIEQMEVLFGPQPVYFGQSAIAGLIGYRSRRPTDELDGYVVAEAGNIGHTKVEGALGGPLGGNWAGRLSAKIVQDDGWTKVFGTGEDGNPNENSAFRLQLSGDIAENFSVWAKYEQFEANTDGSSTDAFPCNVGLSAAPPLVFCDDAIRNGLGEFEYNDTVSFGSSVSAHPFGRAPFGNLDLTQLDIAQRDAIAIDIEGSAAALELVWEPVNGLIVTSLTGFSDYEADRAQDFDFSPYANFAFPNVEEFDQVSQELRVQSDNDGALNWMAGLYWQDQELNFQADIVSALPNPMGPSGTNATEYNEEAQYFGAFAAVAWEVSDEVTLEYGIRHNDVQKDAYLWEVDSYLTNAAGNRISNAGPPNRGMTPLTLVPNGTQATGYSGLLGEMVAGDRCLGKTPNNDDCTVNINPAVLAAWGDTDLSLDENDLTHQLTVNWAFSDSSSVFFRYAEAFKPGGFSRGSSSFIVSTKGIYDAEKADSIEVGGRFGFANGRGQANVTLFSTDYEERQVEQRFDDPVTGVTFLIFQNAANSSINGLEGDLRYVADSGLRFSLAASYAKGEYDLFDDAACFRAEQRMMLGGCRPGGGSIDLSGTEFDGIPNWTITVGLGYDFALGGNLRMNLDTNLTTHDDFDRTRPFASQTPYEFRQQNGFTLINARAAIYPGDGRWEIAAYGRNLTDERYWHTQPSEVGIFGNAVAVINRPATYGVTLRYNFGGA
ncbi:MAG: TonB-dependent receptor [Gammaproteobacteria bacterium]|nr:TonB-dependent receptor [Gammaproteobacteria bacterium]